jgi:hypothetical protein
MYLERWTIDQIMEDAVAVVRARYTHELSEMDTERLAERAVELELKLDPKDWAPEILSVLNRDELLKELELRNAAPSIVASRLNEDEDPRPLFEGQVLWFVTPKRLPAERRKRPIGPADTGWLFKSIPLHRQTVATKVQSMPRRAMREEWEEAGQIVDASQASRLAVKRQYQELIETEQPREV